MLHSSFLTFICWWVFMLSLQFKTLPPELWTDSMKYLLLDAIPAPRSQTFPNMNSVPPTSSVFLTSFVSPWMALSSHGAESHTSPPLLCISMFSHQAVLILCSPHPPPNFISYLPTAHSPLWKLQPKFHYLLSKVLNSFLSPCLPLPGWFF